MKKLVRLLSLVLTLALLTGLLSGCGGKGGDAAGDANPEFVYTASYAPLDLKLDYVNASCWADGTLYFAGQVTKEVPVTPAEGEGSAQGAVGGSAEATSGSAAVTEGTAAEPMPADSYAYKESITATRLFAVKDDGTDPRELEAYAAPALPEGKQGSASINRMAADGAGGLWVLESLYVYWYELPEGMSETDENAWDYYKSEESYYLRRLDSTGAEKALIDLSFMRVEGQDYFHVGNMAADKDGNIYLSNGDNTIFVIDGSGKQLMTVPPAAGGWVGGMIPFADGTVGAITYDEQGQGSLSVVDLASRGYKTLSETIPANAWNFYPGAGDYDFYYNTDTSLFGYDIETAAATNLVTWINADVDSNTISSIMPLPDGRIVCVSRDWKSDNAATELLTMTKTPYAESEKVTLTYACMWLDYNIRSQIIQFNKKNGNYRIEVQDYSQYNTENDYNAGMTKLNTEIIAGKVPDIISVSGLPLRQYAAKGLLEDLWPFIDGDTALGGRDALVQPIFNAMSQDGKLYQIAPSFSVTTTYALASVVGTEPGWTLEEMNAALATLNPGADLLGNTMVKNDMMYNICNMYLGDLVNWETGECYFDDQLFIDLLKLTENMPLTFDYEGYDWQTDYVEPSVRMAQGDQLMNFFSLYSINDALYSLQGDPASFTFIGFPTADGSMGSAFSVESGLVMSSKCKDKEGAWQFLRTFLTDSYQTDSVWSLPTNQKVLDAKLKEAMTPDYYTDENGQKVETPKTTYVDQSGKEIQIFAMDQATADKLMQIIDQTTRMTAYDQNLTNIINEECAVFYAGDKTAEATAAAIQSKVKLYINEQR